MKRADRGAAAVELAIVLPVLFLVIGGIVDFGRFFFTQIQVTNAAREGARVAVVAPGPATSPDPIVQRAQAAAAPLTVTVTVNKRCTVGVAADASVSVQAPFDWIIMGPAVRMVGGTWGFSGPVVSTGVMRCEG
ncbi:TadE/TadG family type IV pilus assembly protein [Terrabacter sp. NPDC080008]|uniref:TadE/TadG family type IV pilus assembly protein n=1 Tax=Terrabacter sp. NPDC080008 TaxID=3155176 RepID=UPI00344DD10B